MAEAALIEIHQLSHHYGTGALRKQVLYDIEASVGAGDIVIVTGPSGSGKTTLLSLTGALRAVQEGSLTVIGEQLSGASPSRLREIRRRIGFIFQQHNLIASLTAAQNVQMALVPESVSQSTARQRAAEVLDSVGLVEYMDRNPKQLSGGQAQRVAIARALVRNPQIVLADEPTASLDRASGREIVEILRRSARTHGCAILLVTHDNRILDLADRVMHLEDGRLQSFESATSSEAGHLIGALQMLPDPAHLRLVWSQLNEPDFIDLLQRVAAESEQLLNVLDLENEARTGQLYGAILDTVLGRVASRIGAAGAKIAASAEGLAIPLRDRHDMPLGFVCFDKDGFSNADSRVLRDYSRSLSLIAEVQRRLTSRSPD